MCRPTARGIPQEWTSRGLICSLVIGQTLCVQVNAILGYDFDYCRGCEGWVTNGNLRLLAIL